jgi:hypothetical protein
VETEQFITYLRAHAATEDVARQLVELVARRRRTVARRIAAVTVSKRVAS